MKNKSIKKYVLLSILIALACVLSIVDTFISHALYGLTPVLAMAPGFKIGLANIVILFIIYNYKFYWGILAVLLKSVIAGLIFAGPINFAIGITGAVLSFVCMYFLRKLLHKELFLVFISAVGGVVHVIGQFIIVLIIYRASELFMYLPFLLITGLISGILVGYICFGVVKIFKVGVKNNE